MDSPALMILLFVGFAIVAIGVSAYLAYLRREMWRRVAERYGFRYHEGDPFDLRRTEPPFKLFQLGHSRKVFNTLEGTWKGIPVRVFDYRYKTGSGKHQQTHHLTGILAALPIRGPALAIRPEHFGDRIAAALGFDDIDFELEAFNTRFHVSGSDKKFAYDVCHPQMMEHLMTAPEHCWELRDDRLLIYSHRLRDFDEAEVARALELVEGFVAHLPAYLRRD